MSVEVEQVGAPDPELRNSPIIEQVSVDDEQDSGGEEEHHCCYFNSKAYPQGTYVCSGSGELLCCERGTWVQAGSCDPDNP